MLQVPWTGRMYKEFRHEAPDNALDDVTLGPAASRRSILREGGSPRAEEPVSRRGARHSSPRGKAPRYSLSTSTLVSWRSPSRSGGTRGDGS